MQPSKPFPVEDGYHQTGLRKPLIMKKKALVFQLVDNKLVNLGFLAGRNISARSQRDVSRGHYA